MPRYLLLLCLLLPYSAIGQLEICDNGIDDDNDSLIDINDDDCSCTLTEPVSLIPNPSFEDMSCCPNDRSQLDCASLWIQASEPTTDYINTCDWLGWDDFPPPRPFPDGEGIMGFRDGRVRGNNDTPEPYWKEYAGACLINPLRADSTYRFQFDVGFVNPQKSPPIDISFFGTSNCDNLPFGIGNEAFGCPTSGPDWIKLAEVRVDGGAGNQWVNTFLEIIPEQDINAIAIGPDCNPISSPISIYYFFDNLLLASVESFDLEISETRHPCNQDYTLSVPYNPNFEYQWYLEGIALVGEVLSELTQNYGEGNYQVRILDEASCRISTTFEYRIPQFEAPARVAICRGDIFQFADRLLNAEGIYIDTFKTPNNCDSIVRLELELVGEQYDTVSISIFEGESYQIDSYTFEEVGEYPLIFTSSLGCDSLVLLQLSNFYIFIPNVFSPNQDGINDIFIPSAPSNEIRSYQTIIFDRWGNQVFEGQSWDGANVQPGVYVYAITFNFTNGQTQNFTGDVTLLR